MQKLKILLLSAIFASTLCVSAYGHGQSSWRSAFQDLITFKPQASAPGTPTGSLNRIYVDSSNKLHYFTNTGTNTALLVPATGSVEVEVNEALFSHKRQISIEGTTYYIMLTDS